MHFKEQHRRCGRHNTTVWWVQIKWILNWKKVEQKCVCLVVVKNRTFTVLEGDGGWKIVLNKFVLVYCWGLVWTSQNIDICMKEKDKIKIDWWLFVRNFSDSVHFENNPFIRGDIHVDKSNSYSCQKIGVFWQIDGKSDLG